MISGYPVYFKDTTYIPRRLLYSTELARRMKMSFSDLRSHGANTRLTRKRENLNWNLHLFLISSVDLTVAQSGPKIIREYKSVVAIYF